MIQKRYDENDTHLIETLTNIGLSQFKIHKLLCVANERAISLQNAYRLTDASILNIDAIILTILFFYVSLIVYLDPDSLYAIVIYNRADFFYFRNDMSFS